HRRCHPGFHPCVGGDTRQPGRCREPAHRAALRPLLRLRRLRRPGPDRLLPVQLRRKRNNRRRLRQPLASRLPLRLEERPMPIDPITGLPTNSGDAMNPGVSPPPTGGLPADAMNPPAAGTPGAPGTWNYPDYQGLLAKWLAPYQQQYEGDVAAGQAGLDASTATARQRYQEGDATTIARLKGVHDDNLRTIRDTLNARGLLGSGVTLRAMGRVQGSGHGAGRLAAGSGEVGYQAGRENLSLQHRRSGAQNERHAEL